MRYSNRIPVHSLWWYLRVMLLTGGALTAAVFAVLALRPLPEGIPVVVAKEDLIAGEPIGLNSVRVLAVTPQAVPGDALTDRDRVEGVSPTETVSANTILTTQNIGINDESDAIPAGFAQIVITVPPEQAFVSAGDRIEIWGVVEGCETETCPIEKIADQVVVKSIDSPEQGAFGGAEQVRVKIVVQATKLGGVLHASSLQRVRFVMRSPQVDGKSDTVP